MTPRPDSSFRAYWRPNPDFTPAAIINMVRDFLATVPIIATLAMATTAVGGNESTSFARGAAAITSLSVNGDLVDVQPGRGIRLPARPEADVYLLFSPFDKRTAGEAGTRLLFKLDGIDADWQDIDPGAHHMRMSVIFWAEDGRTRAMTEFFMKGKSAGWRGTLNASQMTQRTERVPVPPGAKQIQLTLWSGGVFRTVGVMAIDRITVRTFAKGSSQSKTINDFTFETPENSWEKFGSVTDFATTGELHGKPVLELIDSDPENFSGWRLRPKANVVVQEGEEVEISWGEVFSIGGNSTGNVRYSGLRPGTYAFRLAAATTEGVPTGLESVTEIVLPEPLWSRPWVWAACGAAVAGLIFGVWRYLDWNRLQLRMAQLEKAHAVSTERTRIAHDLHDELGGSLTQIALTSELAKEQLADADAARSHLDSIFTTARHLARQLDAVVWAVSPAHDSVESLATFLSKEGQQYLRTAGIGCRLRVPDEFPASHLSSIERRAIFLAVKEALHNVVQHAQATEVRIRMASANGRLTIDVEDDGRGISSDVLAGRLPPGHDGLANMRSRLQGIGGTCEITAGPDGGTRVRLCIPLTEPVTGETT